MLLYLYGNHLMEKLNPPLLSYNLVENCSSLITMFRSKNVSIFLILLDRFPWKSSQTLLSFIETDHLQIVYMPKSSSMMMINIFHFTYPYRFTWNRNRLAKNGAESEPIGIPITSRKIWKPTVKKQFSRRYFTACLRDVGE